MKFEKKNWHRSDTKTGGKNRGLGRGDSTLALTPRANFVVLKFFLWENAVAVIETLFLLFFCLIKIVREMGNGNT